MKPGKITLLIKERHMIPDNKLIICGASYRKSYSAIAFSARWSMPLVRNPHFAPAWFKVNLKTISAHERVAVWACFDANLANVRTLSGEYTLPVRRYRAFMNAMAERGYHFEWQGEGIRRFLTKDAFEDQLYRDAAKPLAYID